MNWINASTSVSNLGVIRKHLPVRLFVTRSHDLVPISAATGTESLVRWEMTAGLAVPQSFPIIETQALATFD